MDISTFQKLVSSDLSDTVVVQSKVQLAGWKFSELSNDVTERLHYMDQSTQFQLKGFEKTILPSGELQEEWTYKKASSPTSENTSLKKQTPEELPTNIGQAWTNLAVKMFESAWDIEDPEHSRYLNKYPAARDRVVGHLISKLRRKGFSSPRLIAMAYSEGGGAQIREMMHKEVAKEGLEGQFQGFWNRLADEGHADGYWMSYKDWEGKLQWQSQKKFEVLGPIGHALLHGPLITGRHGKDPRQDYPDVYEEAGPFPIISKLKTRVPADMQRPGTLESIFTINFTKNHFGQIEDVPEEMQQKMIDYIMPCLPATRPHVIITGTGGDMEGDHKKFAETFYSPHRSQHNIIPFVDSVWKRAWFGPPRLYVDLFKQDMRRKLNRQQTLLPEHTMSTLKRCRMLSKQQKDSLVDARMENIIKTIETVSEEVGLDQEDVYNAMREHYATIYEHEQ